MAKAKASFEYIGLQVGLALVEMEEERPDLEKVFLRMQLALKESATGYRRAVAAGSTARSRQKGAMK